MIKQGCKTSSQHICSLLRCKGTTASDLSDSIGTTLKAGARSILILASNNDNWSPETTNGILQAIPVPVFGASFPALLHNREILHSGTLVIGFSESVEISIISRLSTDQEMIDEQLNHSFSCKPDNKTLLTFVDALTTQTEYFVDSLYNRTGSDVRIIGACAGSLDFIQKPCVFTNTGLLEDAAVLVQIPFEINPGVQHGWKTLDGPYLVTSSNNNQIETLNYKPALEVYRQALKNKTGLEFSDDDFYSAAKIYPLGIVHLDDEFIVRDPLKIHQQSLVCAGHIPENSMIYILQGEIEELCKSSHQAAREARNAHDLASPDMTPSAMVIDCVSRLLFLDREFDQEIEAIVSGAGDVTHLFGALTLGEILSAKTGSANLLNKTTVVGVF
ncbi:MAG: FIST C-terminal domain-containing protein [Gammaproteobacteria bacterium]